MYKLGAISSAGQRERTLRKGEVLRNLVSIISNKFGRALTEPNMSPTSWASRPARPYDTATSRRASASRPASLPSSSSARFPASGTISCPRCLSSAGTGSERCRPRIILFKQTMEQKKDRDGKFVKGAGVGFGKRERERETSGHCKSWKKRIRMLLV